MVKLYTTIIRPHLEYACTVWSPYLQKDIPTLENVQNLLSESALASGQPTMKHC